MSLTFLIVYRYTLLNHYENHMAIDNCRDHAHTRPPLTQITVRGEKKFGQPTLYRKCIGKTQWCSDKSINYRFQEICVN